MTTSAATNNGNGSVSGGTTADTTISAITAQLSQFSFLPNGGTTAAAAMTNGFGNLPTIQLAHSAAAAAAAHGYATGVPSMAGQYQQPHFYPMQYVAQNIEQVIFNISREFRVVICIDMQRGFRKSRSIHTLRLSITGLYKQLYYIL